MATFDNHYSRFILWAKITLPLLALAILSTVFLLAKLVDPSKAIPYAKVNVDEMARERGITAPNYSGITRDGAAISISAKSAKPTEAHNSDVLMTEGFRAEIETSDGAVIVLTSEAGTLDNTAQIAQLEGQVLVESSAGYTIKSEAIEASLADARFTSETPISAVGPVGKITAGRLELVHRNEMYLLVFQNGVKLIYNPEG